MPPILARVEARTLLALFLVAGALWGFAALASEVMEGDTYALDTRLFLALRDPVDAAQPRGPEPLQTVMRDITALGGATILVSLTVVVMVALALRRQPRSALFLGIVVAGGQVLSNGAKAVFERPRPDLVPHATETFATSFPSGHSMMAAATWLTLAMMLARSEPQRRMKAYLLTLAALVTVAVGISRVYLGVHWPTDVLAGWTLGTAWALVCFLAARWLSRRGGIEAERGGP